jgi:hypothetical protein
MEEKAGPSFGSRIIAALVLAVAAYILFKVVIGFAAAIAGTVVIIAAIVAVVWAVHVLRSG